MASYFEEIGGQIAAGSNTWHSTERAQVPAGDGSCSMDLDSATDNLQNFTLDSPRASDNSGPSTEDDSESDVGNLADFLQLSMRRLSLAELDPEFLRRLESQIADTEPRLLQAPPAARQVVDGLPLVTTRGDWRCNICKEHAEGASPACQLPCRCKYHPTCILPWLSKYNCCPCCRHELPTTDPEYNKVNHCGGAAATWPAGQPGRSSKPQTCTDFDYYQ